MSILSKCMARRMVLVAKDCPRDHSRENAEVFGLKKEEEKYSTYIITSCLAGFQERSFALIQKQKG